MEKSFQEVLDKHGCTHLYTIKDISASAEIHKCKNVLVILLHEGMEYRLLAIHGRILFNKYFLVGDHEREQQALDLLDTVIQELKERPLGANNGCDRASREA